jgi:hypothetical protein
MVLAELRAQASSNEGAIAHAGAAICLYEQKENRRSAERARSRLRAIEQG